MVYVIIGTIYWHGTGRISCERHKAKDYYKTAQILLADFSLATSSLHTINIVSTLLMIAFRGLPKPYH